VRVRSLSVALLAGIVLVPVGASSAAAVSLDPTVSATVYKSSVSKRAKRAHYLAGHTTTVTAPTTSVTTPTTALSYAQRVMDATNKERTSRGLRALSFSACADGYADSWAKALSIAGTLSHQPLSPILLTCKARSVGENVAYGNVTAEEMVRMWMNSTGHRANILNPGFTHIGIGDVTTSTGRVYGVQVFLTL
jgi:uncharacterized protein YkwD